MAADEDAGYFQVRAISFASVYDCLAGKLVPVQSDSTDSVHCGNLDLAATWKKDGVL